MRAPRFTTRFEQLAELAAAREPWIALAASAIEPNPFYEPDFLLAAARDLGLPPDEILVVRDGAHGDRPALLMPLMKPRLRDGLIGDARMLYANPFTSLSTPLLRGDCAREALECAFDFLSRNGLPGTLLFPQLAGKRGFAAALDALIRERGLAHADVAGFERAAIETSLGPDEYAARTSRATRRSIARKMRALAARGAVSHAIIPAGGHEAKQALAEFLALESSGWKGRSGTALASRASTRRFAEAAFLGGAPRVLIERLALDGRPVAMNLHLVSGGTAYTAKIAYDETLAELSPGALIDAMSIRLVRAGHVSRIDSCATPDNRVNSLWLEREPIVTMLVATSPSVRPEKLDRLARGMRLAQRAIALARAIRARFTSRR